MIPNTRATIKGRRKLNGRQPAPPPAPKAIADALSVRWPIETERRRLLGALSVDELHAWQAVRAAMLFDYHARAEAAVFTTNTIANVMREEVAA